MSLLKERYTKTNIKYDRGFKIVRESPWGSTERPTITITKWKPVEKEEVPDKKVLDKDEEEVIEFDDETLELAKKLIKEKGVKLNG